MSHNPSISLYLLPFLFFFSCQGQPHKSVVTEQSFGDTVTKRDPHIWLVFQDSKNNYWFGSNGKGVYKYDGETIINSTTEDGLSHGQIREIKEDKLGNIFFTTFEGINKFDGQKITQPKVVTGSDWKLEPDDLWFKGNSVDAYLYRYDGEQLHQLELPGFSFDNDLTDVFLNSSFSAYAVYKIYKDNNGGVWFGTANKGACRYDGKTFRWLYEDHLTNTPGGGSFGIRSFFEDREGKF